MEMRTVRLVRRHTHAGRTYEAGAQLSIQKRLADWLIAQGVASGIGVVDPQIGELSTTQAPSEVSTPPAARTRVPARSGRCCGGRW